MQKRNSSSIIAAVLFLALFSVPPRSSLGQELPSDGWLRKMESEMLGFVDAWDGIAGAAVIDLETGRVTSINGDVIFPQASVIKIPIMLEVFAQRDEGKFRLEDEISVSPDVWVSGSSRLQSRIDQGRPFTVSIVDLLSGMMEVSDNTATNVLIDLVGMNAVNSRLAEMGFTVTRLQRMMMDGDAVQRNAENISTPREMATLLQIIYRRFENGDSSARQMIEIMSGMRGGMRSSVPESFTVAAKTGSIPGSRSESGIVFLDDRPFVLSIMSSYNGSDDMTPVPELSEIAFRYFERLAHSNIYGHRTNVPFQ